MPPTGCPFPAPRASLPRSRSCDARVLAGSIDVATIRAFGRGGAVGRNLPDLSHVRAETTRRLGTAHFNAPQWCEIGRFSSTACPQGQALGSGSARLDPDASVQASRERDPCSRARCRGRTSEPAVVTVGRFGAGASTRRGTRASGSPHSRTSQREPDPRGQPRQWCRGRAARRRRSPGTPAHAGGGEANEQ